MTKPYPTIEAVDQHNGLISRFRQSPGLEEYTGADKKAPARQVVERILVSAEGYTR